LQPSDKTIRALKPKAKPYKASNGQGLYILVTTQGSRLWRFDYRFQGKRLTLSLGKFPDAGLADARQRLADARKMLAQGRDPSSLKQAQNAAANDNFAALAEEWLAKRRKEGLAQTTIDKYEWFVRLVDNDLGRLPVKSIGTRRFCARCAGSRRARNTTRPSACAQMRQTHAVPLSRQAISLLEVLRSATGEGTFCFPSIRTATRPMSEATLNALRLPYGQSDNSRGTFG